MTSPSGSATPETVPWLVCTVGPPATASEDIATAHRNANAVPAKRVIPSPPLTDDNLAQTRASVNANSHVSESDLARGPAAARRGVPRLGTQCDEPCGHEARQA